MEHSVNYVGYYLYLIFQSLEIGIHLKDILYLLYNNKKQLEKVAW